jgi:acetyltransferase-like isoleucine patch superfamily enzyme
MKNIYIVGGNGFAVECSQHISWMSQADKEIKFGGFLGHNGYGKNVDYKTLQKFYLGELSEFEFKEGDYAVIGAGYPLLRKTIYNDLKARNIKLFNLIPPNVYISELVEIGEGNVFAAPCCPAGHVKIGSCNVFNSDVIVGHDAQIGDFNFFGPKSQILGNCKVGNSNIIGAGSVLLPHAKIGDNNKIAPLSAIYKGCKDNCYMLGNPALKAGDI